MIGAALRMAMAGFSAGGGGGGGGGTTFAWNPDDKATGIILSNNNLTAAHSGSEFKNVRGIGPAKASGKWYFEGVLDVAVSNTLQYLGIANVSASLTSRMDTSSITNASVVTAAKDAWAHGVGAVYTESGNLTAGAILQVAVDIDARKVWLGFGGGWKGTGTQDPGTATGGHPAPPDDLFPFYGGYHDTDQLTARFKAADFTYSPPSGFAAWES